MRAPAAAPARARPPSPSPRRQRRARRVRRAGSPSAVPSASALGRAVTRILGLDLGEKRIGVAVADADGMAMPLTTLRRASTRRADADAIARAPRRPGRDRDRRRPAARGGRPGRRARPGSRARGSTPSAPHLAAPVRYRDERLTSHVAEQRLGPMKRGRSGGPAQPDPARRPPGPDRPRSRGDHPPGRARRPAADPIRPDTEATR